MKKHTNLTMGTLYCAVGVISLGLIVSVGDSIRFARLGKPSATSGQTLGIQTTPQTTDAEKLTNTSGKINTTEPQVEVQTTSQVLPQLRDFTLDEVQSHSSRESCLVAADGKVYELTSFIRETPESNIVSVCGTDFSATLTLAKQNNVELVISLPLNYEKYLIGNLSN